MKKSLMAILVVFVMIFALACGGKESESVTESVPESVQSSETVSESQTSEPNSESQSEEESITYVTITFVQDGYEDIVVEIQQGLTLENVPNPQEIIGHTVVWDVTDFSAINQSMTVTAIATPNRYEVSYNLGDHVGDATIANETTVVVYGESYTLEIPTCDGYAFVCWVVEGTQEVFSSAIEWTLTENVRLVAVWEIDFASGSGETGRY